MVVFADKSREAELIEIWKQSFGDSEEYIRMFFAWNLAKTMVLVYEVDGKAVSVAYLLPVTYEKTGQKAVPCWYLYAAATLPEYRGRGHFGEIVKVVREHIAEPVLLVPGEASLVSYYEKQGMQVWLEEQYLDIITHAEKPSAKCKHDGLVQGHIKDLTAAEYAVKRQKALAGKSYIKWDEHFMNYICHENKICGGTQKAVTVEGREYIVMCRIEGDILNFLEILPQDTCLEQQSPLDKAKLEACVQILLRETGCKKARVCLNPTVMFTDKLEICENQGYFNLTMG